MSRLRISSLALFSLLLPLGVFLSDLPTRAQDGQSKQEKKAESELRTIHGMVLDKDENPAPSSVVYLLNRRTQAVRTYIADSSGQYRFSGLDPNADYEIHAEGGDLQSATRIISTYDSRRDVDMSFKLTHRKSEK